MLVALQVPHKHGSPSLVDSPSEGMQNPKSDGGTAPPLIGSGVLSIDGAWVGSGAGRSGSVGCREGDPVGALLGLFVGLSDGYERYHI